MSLPNLDTRRLKIENGKFTVELRADRGPWASLCDHCGRERDCAVFARVDDMAEVHVRACSLFMPVLSFSVLEGLDLPAWNTVRIGAAWNERLTVGSIVAIADVKAGELRRRMTVTNLAAQPLGELLEAHAAQNHAILGRGVPEKDAPAELYRIVRNAYGTSYTSPSRMATAIYLRALA